jgi:MFS family permease
VSQRALLFITLFNSILGLSVLFPVLGPLGRSLGLTELQIGLLSTSYALMQFLASPMWGRRSERVGRKPIILIGVLGFAVSFLLFGAVAQLGLAGVIDELWVFVLLLGSRMVGGIFSSATIPTAQAYMADSTERDRRAAGMALLGAAFGLGVIVGPALGAALSGISLLAPVYFSAGFALLNALFVWRRLPESKQGPPSPHPVRFSPVAGKLWPLLAVGLSVSLASVAMEQTVAFYYQDRLQLGGAETARAVGMALVCYGIVAVFVQGYVVRRYNWHPLNLLRAGLPIALLGFVTLIFAEGFLILTLALAIQSFGQALTLPGVTAALSLGAQDDEQGVAAGLNSSAHALGRMLGPVVGTSLYGIRPEYPYVFSAMLLTVVIAFVIGSRRLGRHLTSSVA